jgi:hypothetical protein
MELIAIQKEWAAICKKEIPKVYKSFQKIKGDMEQNSKKILANVGKVVLKKHGKTYR